MKELKFKVDQDGKAVDHLFTGCSCIGCTACALCTLCVTCLACAPACAATLGIGTVPALAAITASVTASVTTSVTAATTAGCISKASA